MNSNSLPDSRHFQSNELKKNEELDTYSQSQEPYEEKANMDKVIEINTNGHRAGIAREIGITKQGLASKLNAKPLSFLEQIIFAVRGYSEAKALNIYADLRARLDMRLFPTKRKWKLVEVVEIWQQIFISEIRFPDIDRWQLLQRWREIVVLGNLRICELTEQLEGKPKFGFA